MNRAGRKHAQMARGTDISVQERRTNSPHQPFFQSSQRASARLPSVPTDLNGVANGVKSYNRVCERLGRSEQVEENTKSAKILASTVAP
jgi:hypothetical protein